jgi:hypothetical protein
VENTDGGREENPAQVRFWDTSQSFPKRSTDLPIEDKEIAGRSRFIFLGKEFPEAIEAAFPKRTTIVDPALGYRKAFWFDMAGANAADFFGLHEAAGFEDLQVLNDSSECDAERFGEARDGDGAFAQFLHNGAACRIAESVEDAVDGSGLRVHLICLRVLVALIRQCSCQIVEEHAPTVLAPFRAVGAFKEGGLLGEDEIGAFVVCQ